MANFSNYTREDRPFVIAEIGNNHEGDMGLARELIHAAHHAGVDSVKFQAMVPDSLVTADQVQRLNQLNKICFKIDQFQELSELANDLGLVFFTSIFDPTTLPELLKIQSLFKIPSGDNTYLDLVDAVVATQCPTIISTGGLSINDIVALKDHVLSQQNGTGMLSLMHCVSNYPTLPENAQLSMIEVLIDLMPDVTIGYSDHTLGNSACYIAAAMGARIIEKHFTISHTYSDFRDHALSAEPKQLAELMKSLPEAYAYSGRQKTDADRSDAGMAGVRRKAVAAQLIKAGEEFSTQNISWKRSLETIGVTNRDELYGKSSSKDIQSGELITQEHISG